MPRYAALLRGINVGGRQKVAMADLKALLTGLGYTEVTTLLQSGNVAFTHRRSKTQALEEQIEQALEKKLKLSVRCLVRSAEELAEVIDGNPLAKVANDGSRYLALFLSAQPPATVIAENDPTTLDPKHIRVGDRVVYQWCPDGISQAPLLGPFLEKKWKVAVTARNWNTVLKLSALLDG